jgi:protein-S-isoprenylcysteine O-methyltransferase Ste14
MRITTGLLIVAAAMLIAVGGLVLVQRLVSTERRQQHNDVAGFIYAVLGVAYAVLLGLMLVAVWEQWNAAEATTTDEASELAEVFWLAHRLPQPEGRHIQELARSYAQVVVEEEWPLMQQGRASPKAWELLDEMRGSIEQLDPNTDTQLMLLYDQALLERMHGLADARRERLLDAEEGLPNILWVVLILGGVIAVGFTYLFGLESTTVHVLMVAALAMIFALALFTVAALDYPFKGDVHVHPAAFEQVLERFHESKLSDL